MESRQALQIVNNVVEDFKCNKADRLTLDMAIAVLTSVIKRQEVADKEVAMKSAAEQAEAAKRETKAAEQTDQETNSAKSKAS